MLKFLPALLLRYLPKSTIIRNIFLLSGSTATAQLIGVCAMPFVTRLYTPTALGTISIFLSFFAFWANTLSLRYEYALLIAEDDAESHTVHRLATFIVLFMSLLGVPILWMFQHFNVLEFALLPVWSAVVALPIFMGYGLFMVYRSWALRGGLLPQITQASIVRAAANSGTKLGLGIFGGSVVNLFIAELVAACASLMKLMQATKRHFAISKPAHIGFTQMRVVGKKFLKFPLFETPSACLDALALALPLPFVASLYGVEAAGWFGLARMVVSVPNGQIGSAVADVFQMEIAKAALRGDSQRAHDLFYLFLKKMALLGLFPLFGATLVLPLIFPIVFGHQWGQAGIIAACMAPWLYAAFIVSPLSRALSVFQAQELKLIYDIFTLGLLVCSYFIAKTQEFTLLEFCLLISGANFVSYFVYALVLMKLFNIQLKKGNNTNSDDSESCAE